MWNRDCKLDTVTRIDSGFESYSSAAKSPMRSHANTSCSEASYQDMEWNELEDNSPQMTIEPKYNAAVIRRDDKWSQIPNVCLLEQSYEFFYAQDEDGDTLLHMSVMYKQLEASLWIISKAPHPCLLDIRNDDRQTALHLAVMNREPKIVEYLVLSGANAELVTRDGNSPLHLACSVGDFDCLMSVTQQLFKLQRLHNCLELRNKDGMTCLHIAVNKNNVDQARHLVRIGANACHREGHAGMTALHIAVRNRSAAMVRLLVLERPECLEFPDYRGWTPYRYATDNDDQHIAEELIKLGAKPEYYESDSSASDSESSSDEELDYSPCSSAKAA